MRTTIVVVALANLVLVTGCGKPKPLKYDDMEKADLEVSRMYGKKTEPERLAALEDKIGKPHLVEGDKGSWYGIRDEGGGKKSCQVLRVSGIDMKHGPLGFSISDAPKPADCGL